MPQEHKLFMITFLIKVAIWWYTAFASTPTETVVLRPPSSHGDCQRRARASVAHASAFGKEYPES